MSGFQLDTSGVVDAPAGQLFDGSRVGCIWSDLTPFCQGYVEAMFADMDPDMRLSREPQEFYWVLGFRDLAPATVERIIGDCERYCAESAVPIEDSRKCGAIYWSERQDGHVSNIPTPHPPLTPYLGDDGLIYLREAA